MAKDGRRGELALKDFPVIDRESKGENERECKREREGARGKE